MLQIALPNKGSLSEDAVELVKSGGYSCRRHGRELMVLDAENDVKFVFLRPRDIAVYVGDGTVDLGITGRDLVGDGEARVVELLPLGFGKSTFRYAVPVECDRLPDDFEGMRIATSYPKLVREDMARRGVNVEVVRLDGAVEISVQLGVADAIADVVETGRTLVQAGLKVVGEPVLASEAVLVARDAALTEEPAVRTFIERLRGIIVARTFVMVEYDVSAVCLDEACRVTPGIESPTVAPLSKEGWVAVKSMSRRADVNRIIDQLAELGAKGIIVTDIRTCRI